MQDIAGCRVTAQDIYSQEACILEISNLFEADGVPFSLVDRRVNPSHGYRAVHLIAHLINRHIEIQIRTDLQHVWAESCEALSDAFGPEVKYGGGKPEVRDILQTTSSMIGQEERLETELLSIALPLLQSDDLPEVRRREIAAVQERGRSLRREMIEGLKAAVEKLKDAISNSIQSQ